MISEKLKKAENMGGYSSGRKSEHSCTNEHLSIDVRSWQREQLLLTGASFTSTWSRNGETIGNIGVRIMHKQVRLSYSCQKNGGEKESLDYPVQLVATTCHYGGERYWFICPAVNCGKRVAKLYLGDKYFACRQCYQLTYQSQRETKDDRASRRAEKIRAKLDWQPGIINLPGDKPKGMHWSTYLRLMAAYRDDVHQAWLGMAAKMAILNSRVSVLSDRL
jgi:hypothetical protein